MNSNYYQLGTAAQSRAVHSPKVHSHSAPAQEPTPGPQRGSASPAPQVKATGADDPAQGRPRARPCPRGGFVSRLISISPDKHAAGAATSLHSKCLGSPPRVGPANELIYSYFAY